MDPDISAGTSSSFEVQSDCDGRSDRGLGTRSFLAPVCKNAWVRMWCVVLGEMCHVYEGVWVRVRGMRETGAREASWLGSRYRAVCAWAGGRAGEEGVWDLGDSAVGEIREV